MDLPPVEGDYPSTWNRVDDEVFYRKVPVYERCWDHLEFSKHKFVGCPNGGPIVTLRDNSKIVSVERDPDPTLGFYTSSGIALASLKATSFFYDIVAMGWNNSEKLCILLQDGTVLLYTIRGEPVNKFKLETECAQGGILSAQFWDSGFVLLTKNFQFHAMMDFESPYTVKLRSPGISEVPHSWIIMKPEQSKDNQLTVYCATASGTVLLVTEESVTNSHCEDKGPFKKMALSANGKILALYTKSGNIWIVQSDFSKAWVTYPASDHFSHPPKQMEWCGIDSVLCYWEGDETHTFVMISPRHDKKYVYTSPLYLLPEIDGIRVLSQNVGTEYLQRVRKATSLIYTRKSPVALLLEAHEAFAQSNAKADELMRSLKSKGELATAVGYCIEAAGYEFDTTLQEKLLGAASYGKGNLRGYNPDKFVAMCRLLRVMNCVREPQIGIMITIGQYQDLTPDRLIERLIYRHQHLLATEISKYLDLKTERVLVHWATAQVSSNKSLEAAQLVKLLIEKLEKTQTNISFAGIASQAYKAGRNDVAILLLEQEPKASHQVPLLIKMGNLKLALRYSVLSGDTDLIDLVVASLKRTLGNDDFWNTLVTVPDAYHVYKTNCVGTKDQNQFEMLLKFENRLSQLGYLAAQAAFAEKDTNVQEAKLKQALEYYKRVDIFSAKATEEEIGLLIEQRDLEYIFRGDKFIGLSINETIYKCICLGGDSRADKLAANFKIPPKRFHHTKLRALCDCKKWEQLKEFSKKSSPIGYDPFVEACTKAGNHELAQYFSTLTSKPEEKSSGFKLFG